MNVLVTYQSKTGFTEKYARWIAEALACTAADANKVTAKEVEEADIVVHGGWIMGGLINGLERIRAYQPKKMGFFGRLIVKMVTKKKMEFTDHTDQGAITELVQKVKRF